MLYFVLEVVAASILASLFASWIKVIPRYPKKRYFVIQQLTNTMLLTIVLNLLFVLKIDLPFPVICVIVLAIMWISVLFTNSVARGRGDLA